MGFGSGFGKSFTSATRFRPVVLGGGGGGVTAPTLELGVTFGEFSRTLEYDIVNLDEENPAVVELAFSLSALEAAEFDDGTAASPSFALDPGSTRGVSFTRGGGAPGFGDPSVEETITATLADGSTITQTVDVEALGSFKAVLAGISPPTFEFAFATAQGPGVETCVNTGTESSYLADMLNCQTTTGSVAAFDGKVRTNAGNDEIKDTIPSNLIGRTADRSWIFVFDTYASPIATRYLNFGTIAGSNNAWGWIRSTGGPTFVSQHMWSGSGVNLSATLGTHSGGVPDDKEDFLIEMMDDLETPRRSIFVVTWTHGSPGTATIRWKQTSDGIPVTGHTYITDPANPDSAGVDQLTRWIGYSTLAATTVDWRYIGVVDTVLSAADFDTLAEVALA
jgi:hypothetical protein